MSENILFGTVASIRGTWMITRKCCLCSVSVVADSVAPALSLSVETFAVIMTGPCLAINYLIYLKSLMCGSLFLISNALVELMR